MLMKMEKAEKTLLSIEVLTDIPKEDLAAMVLSMKKHIVVVLLELESNGKINLRVKNVPFVDAKQQMAQRSKRSKVEMFS